MPASACTRARNASFVSRKRHQRREQVGQGAQIDVGATAHHRFDVDEHPAQPALAAEEERRRRVAGPGDQLRQLVHREHRREERHECRLRCRRQGSHLGQQGVGLRAPRSRPGSVELVGAQSEPAESSEHVELVRRPRRPHHLGVRTGLGELLHEPVQRQGGGSRPGDVDLSPGEAPWVRRTRASGVGDVGEGAQQVSHRRQVPGRGQQGPRHGQ